MEDTIKIEGQEGNFKLKKVEKLVVKITDKYYYKHDDERVVPIKNEQDKIRYYKTNSPLLCQDSDTGKAVLKSTCYLTEDGVYLSKNSDSVVSIDNKYYRKAFCTRIDGVWYLKSSDLVQESVGGGYFLKSKGIKLSEKYYKKSNIVPPNTKVVTTHDGHVIKADAAVTYFDLVKNTKIIEFKPILKETLCSVPFDFQDKTNPQEERLEYVNILSSQIGMLTLLTLPSGANWTVPPNRYNYFVDCIETYIRPRYFNKIELIREKINSNYSDLDKEENIAKDFKIISKPFTGKSNLITPNTAGQAIRSKNFKLTGGLEYSFGIEFETSQGLIPTKELLEPLHTQCVGDRSIGAGEYVTAPMMGDDGVEIIKQLCKLLNAYTLVDDRCAIHVHVGSLFKAKVVEGKTTTPEPKQAPSFSKQFLMNSVNLGALIEEELYCSLPKNRKPTLYHCHSIKRFAPCDSKNYNTNMGAYIFGEREWWLEPTESCPTKLFDFEKFKLNIERNQHTNVGTWPDGRYKWLNLIPSYLAIPNRTIEFRIFSGTTVFNKVYAYLLTSLAFTYVADNCPALIKPGITLSQMHNAAFKDSPKIMEFLNEFYAERTAKFNRTNIYGNLNLPFLNK